MDRNRRTKVMMRKKRQLANFSFPSSSSTMIVIISIIKDQKRSRLDETTTEKRKRETTQEISFFLFCITRTMMILFDQMMRVFLQQHQI